MAVLLSMVRGYGYFTSCAKVLELFIEFVSPAGFSAGPSGQQVVYYQLFFLPLYIHHRYQYAMPTSHIKTVIVREEGQASQYFSPVGVVLPLECDMLYGA